MDRRIGVIGIVVLVALVAGGAGCGGPRAGGTKPGEEKKAPPPPPGRTRMENATVKLRDPRGEWTFDVTAKQVASLRAKGPYEMQEAQGLYRRPREPKQAPVRMWAKRIELDEKRQRVTLTGAVRIVSEGVMIEGERMSYDLKTQKVIAGPRTKWTIVPAEMGGRGNTKALRHKGDKATAGGVRD